MRTAGSVARCCVEHRQQVRPARAARAAGPSGVSRIPRRCRISLRSASADRGLALEVGQRKPRRPGLAGGGEATGVRTRRGPRAAPSGWLKPVIAPAAPHASSSSRPTPPRPPKTGRSVPAVRAATDGAVGVDSALTATTNGHAAHRPRGASAGVTCTPETHGVVLQHDAVRRSRRGSAAGGRSARRARGEWACTITARQRTGGGVEAAPCLLDAPPPSSGRRARPPPAGRWRRGHGGAALLACSTERQGGRLAEDPERDHAACADPLGELDLPAQRRVVDVAVGVEGGREHHPEPAAQRRVLTGSVALRSPDRPSTASTRCSAMARLEVAPGDGALRSATTGPAEADPEVVDQAAVAVERLGADAARSGHDVLDPQLGHVAAGGGDEPRACSASRPSRATPVRQCWRAKLAEAGRARRSRAGRAARRAASRSPRGPARARRSGRPSPHRRPAASGARPGTGSAGRAPGRRAR